MARRVVSVSVVPGTGGRFVSGDDADYETWRVCVHLLVRDERGPITESHVMHPQADPTTDQPIKGKFEMRPTRMRLACSAKRKVEPITRQGVTTVVPRSEDPRAVTCLKCRSSEDYARAMERLAQPARTADKKEG